MGLDSRSHAKAQADDPRNRTCGGCLTEATIRRIVREELDDALKRAARRAARGIARRGPGTVT